MLYVDVWLHSEEEYHCHVNEGIVLWAHGILKLKSYTKITYENDNRKVTQKSQMKMIIEKNMGEHKMGSDIFIISNRYIYRKLIHKYYGPRNNVRRKSCRCKQPQ